MSDHNLMLAKQFHTFSGNDHGMDLQIVISLHNSPCMMNCCYAWVNSRSFLVSDLSTYLETKCSPKGLRSWQSNWLLALTGWLTLYRTLFNIISDLILSEGRASTNVLLGIQPIVFIAWSFLEILTKTVFCLSWYCDLFLFIVTLTVISCLW